MKHQSGKLRIIGGVFRRRMLTFPAIEGLRPTPDRVRETLFNWLAEYIEGARCLDLFAGSGALGLEALSRGAGEIILVESNRSAACAIKANIELLGANRARVETMDAVQFLSGSVKAFDIVFLDPPFDSRLLARSVRTLAENSLLHPGGRVYIEHRVQDLAPHLPVGWRETKKNRAGDVCARLWINGAGVN